MKLVGEREEDSEVKGKMAAEDSTVATRRKRLLACLCMGFVGVCLFMLFVLELTLL